MENYYELLGLNPFANELEIKTAYRKMAIKYHPDKTAGDKGLAEKFLIIKEAYEVLSDKVRRAKYDDQLLKGGNAKRNSGSSKSASKEKEDILEAIREISALLKTYEKDRKKMTDSLSSLDKEIAEMKDVLDRLNKRLTILNS